MTTYNMALGGYGPVHSLILLPEAITLRPRMIVEAFYSGNDLYDSYRLVYRKRQFSELKTDQPDILARIGTAEQVEPLKAKIIRLTPFESARLTGSYNRSKCCQLLQAARSWLHARLESSDWMSTVYWMTAAPVFRRRTSYEVVEVGEVRTVLTPAYRLVALDLHDPRIAEGLRISLEAMARMQRQAQAAQVAYAVLLIPTKELVCADVVPAKARSTVYAELTEQEERLWQVMKASLAARAIPVIDALPALRASVRHQHLPYFMSRDGHLNVLGQRIIAELVFSHLQEPHVPGTMAGTHPGSTLQQRWAQVSDQ